MSADRLETAVEEALRRIFANRRRRYTRSEMAHAIVQELRKILLDNGVK